MAVVLSLLLLLAAGSCAAQMRTVELEGRWYSFWDLPLPWDSAAVVCERSGMRLAAVGDDELLDFVARQTAGSAWATWLGGRRGGPEHQRDAASAESWRWTASLERLSTPVNEWVDTAPPDHCLALASTPPHLAAVADLPCHTPLPFVCERADEATPNFVQSLQLPDRTVTFVEALSTFDEAEKMCRAFNGWLVTANTPELQKALTNVTKKLHGAWLGGRTDASGTVRWMATDQPVALLGERSLLLFEEDSELVVTHDEVTLKKAKRQVDTTTSAPKCLLIDRKGVLREADCATRNGFVCETRSKSYFPITTEMLINNKRIKVSTHMYSWEGAKKACAAFKGKIANLRDMSEIVSLARMPQEFQDLWVDGRRDAEGRWTDSEGKEIPKDSDEKGYPPWAVPNPERHYVACLSIYRQSLTQVVFVPRNCDETHGFACVREPRT